MPKDTVSTASNDPNADGGYEPPQNPTDDHPGWLATKIAVAAFLADFIASTLIGFPSPTWSIILATYLACQPPESGAASAGRKLLAMMVGVVLGVAGAWANQFVPNGASAATFLGHRHRRRHPGRPVGGLRLRGGRRDRHHLLRAVRRGAGDRRGAAGGHHDRRGMHRRPHGRVPRGTVPGVASRTQLTAGAAAVRLLTSVDKAGKRSQADGGHIHGNGGSGRPRRGRRVDLGALRAGDLHREGRDAGAARGIGDGLGGLAAEDPPVPHLAAQRGEVRPRLLVRGAPGRALRADRRAAAQRGGAHLRGRDGGMDAVPPRRRRPDRGRAGAHRPVDGRRNLEGAGPTDLRADLPRHRGQRRAVRRPLRHGLGHHARLPADRGHAEHVARRRRAGHRRGASGDRPRPPGGHSGGDLLQQAGPRRGSHRGRLRGVRRRVRDHHQPAGRRRGAVPPARRPERWARASSHRAAARSGAGGAAGGPRRRCRRSTSRPSST